MNDKIMLLNAFISNQIIFRAIQFLRSNAGTKLLKTHNSALRVFNACNQLPFYELFSAFMEIITRH